MKSLVSLVVIAVVSLLLTACGGGTKAGASSSTTSTTTYAVQVGLYTTDGVAATHFTAGTQGVVRANVQQTVKTTDGTVTSTKSGAAANVIVTFTTSGGAIEPSNGTALTDGNGNAQVVLDVGTTAGAYALNAAVNGASSAANYLVDNALQPELTLTIADEHGNPTQTIAAGSIATITVSAQELVQVVGQPGGTLQPAANELITVSTDGGTFDPTTGQAVTDAGGKATVRLKPNLTDGGFTLSATATINGVVVNAVTHYEISVPQVYLGSGTPFQQGTLLITPRELVSGTPATVSVLLVDAAGNPFALPVQIDFDSQCAKAGTAAIASPIPAINGAASTHYTPGQGCLGIDTIEATALLPGQSIPVTASGTIKVDPAPPSGLSFVSNSPATIALRGRGHSGLPDFSTVTFKVISSSGVGVPGQAVNFATTSVAGGITLDNSTATSDNAGNVTTVLHAGTVPLSVEVTATLANGVGPSTNSAPILISSGVAEQSGFSISGTTLNIEGANYDGNQTQLTIRAADHYGNPVPDGTLVAFTTDGGSVAPSCATQSGVCSVMLTSQNPRPTNGRAVVLATAVGDETFTDTNGNGLYDDGEPFVDMPEPWRDDNENGKYELGEFFIDANGNSKWDSPNGVYDGSLCNPGAHCNPKGAYVRQSEVIVFSTSKAQIFISPSNINVDDVTAVRLQFSISDLNGNLPPAGSVVTVTSSNGKLLDPTTYTVGNSNAKGPLVFTNTIIGDGTPSSGTLLVELKTPLGTVTDAQATVTDTHKAVTVGALAMNPATVVLNANFSGNVQTQAVVSSNATPPTPLAGVTPIINCNQGTSTGLSLTPPTSLQPTDSNGTTPIVIAAMTGPAVSGTATCTITAGTKSATFTINLM